MNLRVVKRRSGDDRLDAAARDAGFSLTEIIITVTLMTMVIIPLMMAAVTTLKSSTSVREIAEIETVLQNAADRVNRAPADCTYLEYVQAAVRSKGWKKEQASVTESHYDPGNTPGILTPGTWATDACPPEGRTDRLVQLVTITVTNPRATISRSIQVVKSDV